MPVLQLNKKLLDDLAAKTVNQRIAVTGVQPKLSVSLEQDKGAARLTIVGLWGNYILKPQHEEFLYMPETEDLTMHLANLFKIKTCAHTLIRTSEGDLAYLAKRFDRENGLKIHTEDFCQLSGFLTEQKYKGSYEKVGKLIQQYCTNKGFDALNYFELVLFSFLSGNNDMHLKNFSVVHANQEIALAPAYDLLNVNLIFPEDDEEMALTLNGKKKKIAKRDFDSLAEKLNLPAKAVANIYKKFTSQRGQVLNLIQASFLPEEAKDRYIEIWDEKAGKLA
ncbi:MAG: HipA domain-containing protein [Mucilaginibacter sp.]|uniref:HipA domain-containing protein n=1 Tax=Mucilaginibacter sp. TaxID=1882438 RepID=UPI0034E5D564